MHIWNLTWPFIYEHHNCVPMLRSVTFDEIATLVWNFCLAHTFVARWIRYSCVYFYLRPFGLWPFRFVAVPVCGRFGLWPFRSVAISVCGRFGLWPFRSVAVPVCGRFGLWPFRFWPFRFVAVMTRIPMNMVLLNWISMECCNCVINKMVTDNEPHCYISFPTACSFDTEFILIFDCQAGNVHNVNIGYLLINCFPSCWP